MYDTYTKEQRPDGMIRESVSQSRSTDGALGRHWLIGLGVRPAVTVGNSGRSLTARRQHHGFYTAKWGVWSSSFFLELMNSLGLPRFCPAPRILRDLERAGGQTGQASGP